jgi:hypothetical protein
MALPASSRNTGYAVVMPKGQADDQDDPELVEKFNKFFHD